VDKDDDELLLHIIPGLLPSYDVMVKMIVHGGIDGMGHSLDAATDMLVSEEKTLSKRGSSVSFVAPGDNRPGVSSASSGSRGDRGERGHRSSSKPDMSSVKCYGCNEMGHFRRRGDVNTLACIIRFEGERNADDWGGASTRLRRTTSRTSEMCSSTTTQWRARHTSALPTRTTVDSRFSATAPSPSGRPSPESARTWCCTTWRTHRRPGSTCCLARASTSWEQRSSPGSHGMYCLVNELHHQRAIMAIADLGYVADDSPKKQSSGGKAAAVGCFCGVVAAQLRRRERQREARQAHPPEDGTHPPEDGTQPHKARQLGQGHGAGVQVR
jgi:hypothetical protein